MNSVSSLRVPIKNMYEYNCVVDRLLMSSAPLKAVGRKESFEFRIKQGFKRLVVKIVKLKLFNTIKN